MLLRQAEQLGKKAATENINFHNDKNLMEMLKNCYLKEASELLQAWQKGFSSEKNNSNKKTDQFDKFFFK